jgi:hypothetical protein
MRSGSNFANNKGRGRRVIYVSDIQPFSFAYPQIYFLFNFVYPELLVHNLVHNSSYT